MRFVVFDLEFNQPSGSIIQIGAVELNLESHSVKPFFDEIVNPEEEIDPFVSNLTGIDENDLENAPPLKDTLRSFWGKYQNLDHTRLAAWGDDIQWLTNQSSDLHVPSFQYYNVQKWFRFVEASRGNSFCEGVGLKNTLQSFDLCFSGDHHNAFDDAKMTAHLMMELSKGIDDYYTKD